MERSAFWSLGLVALLLPVGGLPWNDTGDASGGGPGALATGPRDHAGTWEFRSAPLGAIHTALMPDGKVLLYSFTNSYVFDPGTRAFSPQITSNTNVFCSGMAMLADGRLLAVGGTLRFDAQGFWGLRSAEAFDPGREQWAQVGNMSEPRWYPTAVTLPTGLVAVFGGLEGPSGVTNRIEVFDPVTGTFTYKGRGSFDLLPRAHLMPDGKVVIAGPQVQTFAWDPASGVVSTIANRPGGYRGGGNSVLLDSAKGTLLALGGSPNYGTSELWDPAANQWRPGPRLNHPRIWSDSTLLPTGDVLVVGGELDPFGAAAAEPGHDHAHGLHPLDHHDVAPAELMPMAAQPAEYYDAKTNSFVVVATQARPRQYHSEGLLLPDGSVFMSGPEASVEIYKPWYFFAGPRPRITDAPEAVVYGAPFAVASPDSASVQRAVLMRLASQTHAHSSDQRLVELGIHSKALGNQVVLGGPLPNVAPPGYYMLFLLNGAGVPSTARIVQVGPGLGQPWTQA